MNSRIEHSKEHPGPHCMGKIKNVDFDEMKEILGKPNAEDDPTKVDACWVVQDKKDPAKLVSVWNYKNGPAYLGDDVQMGEIKSWSIWYNDKELAQTLFPQMKG